MEEKRRGPDWSNSIPFKTVTEVIHGFSTGPETGSGERYPREIIIQRGGGKLQEKKKERKRCECDSVNPLPRFARKGWEVNKDDVQRSGGEEEFTFVINTIRVKGKAGGDFEAGLS